MCSVGCVCDPVEVPRDDCTCIECRGQEAKRRLYGRDFPTRVVKKYTPPSNTNGGNGHPEYLRILEERKAIHIEKSGGYGTPADPFANFNAVAELSGQPAWVYPMLRAQEKLTRCWSLYEQGREGELGEEFTDISSLLDCAEALRRASHTQP